jgi:hypothetical protein
MEDASNVTKAKELASDLKKLQVQAGAPPPAQSPRPAWPAC